MQNAIDKRWHVGKEIPIAIVAALILQTFGVVWGAATLSAKVDNLKEQVAMLTQNQGTISGAREQANINSTRNTDQDRRLSDIESRVRELEKAGRTR